MGKLDGKVALVTGATTGIGFATAQLFANEGARVIATGRNEKTLAEAKVQFKGTVEVLQSDTSSLAHIEELFTHIAKHYGKLDVLFGNAGIAQFAPHSDVTEAFFDQTFNVNVKGLYFTIQQSAKNMNDGGSIILNASVSASLGQPGASIYGATKAAVRSFGRTFAAELAQRHIRVNTISPGPITTPIFGKMEAPQEVKDGFVAQITEMVPLKRFGLASEVATVALFLASADSSYVNAAEIVVDGGMIGV